MPLFEYQAPDGEILSLILDAKQPAEAYRVQKANGKIYKRIYTAPTMGVNTQARDARSDDYRRITENKNLTVGQMTDISKELSEKRAEKEGVDQVKEQFYKSYEKNIGVKHKDQIKKEKRAKAEASLKKFGVKVDLKAK